MVPVALFERAKPAKLLAPLTDIVARVRLVRRQSVFMVDGSQRNVVRKSLALYYNILVSQPLIDMLDVLNWSAMWEHREWAQNLHFNDQMKTSGSNV